MKKQEDPKKLKLKSSTTSELNLYTPESPDIKNQPKKISYLGEFDKKNSHQPSISNNNIALQNKSSSKSKNPVANSFINSNDSGIEFFAPSPMN